MNGPVPTSRFIELFSHAGHCDSGIFELRYASQPAHVTSATGFMFRSIAPLDVENSSRLKYSG